MRKPKLSPQQKEVICRMYASGNWTMEELAKGYNVNRRTIQRALMEGGYIPPVTMASTRDRQIIAMVRQYAAEDFSLIAGAALLHDLKRLLQPQAKTRRAA